MEKQMEMDDALKRLISSVDGVKSLVVSSREGILIASTGEEVDIPLVCALGAKLISTSRSVGERLGLGGFESTASEFEDRTILAYGRESISMIAILEKGSNTELVKMLLRSAVEKIEAPI